MLEDWFHKLTKKSFYPWLLWALGASFFFSENFAHVSLSVMLPQLMSAFSVGAFALGVLSACFWYPYISMQVPVGALLDRYNPHYVLTLTAITCGLSCVLFCLAHSFFIAGFARCVTGLTASFAFVSTLKLCKMWFPPERFGFLAGLTQALGMIGAVVGQAPVVFLVAAIGWRAGMGVIGASLIFIGILIFIFVREHPNAAHQKNALAGMNLWHGFVSVLKNPQSWINGLYLGLLYAPTSVFGELWGVDYYAHVYHFPKETAATITSFIFMGWGIGGPLMGMLSDKLQRRKPVLIVSVICSLIFLASAMYIPHLSKFLLCFFLFIYGVSNTGVGVSYALSGEINKPEVSGISLAFGNMTSVIIGALLQPVVGWLLELQWDHKMINGVPIYSSQAYEYAMLILIACLFLGILTSFFIRETYCREAYPSNVSSNEEVH